MINHLKLLKEYIDAKAAYDRAGLGVSTGLLSPSVSLTESGQQIKDRYLTAERALTQEIEMVEFERIERQEKLLPVR